MSDDENKNPPDGELKAEGGTGSGRAATLMDKIRGTLSNTPAERWEQGGEPLDTKRRFQRGQERWEEVYCTDTKSGVLVLRRSTPLAANFFGGGYNFSPSGPSRYAVELRGRGWSPKSLLDPSFRGAGGAEKSMQTLAEGDVAEELFKEVESVIKGHRENLRRDFNDSVSRLTANLKEHIGETTAADWELVEGDVGVKGYRTDLNGVVLTVACSSSDVSTAYSLTLSRYGLVWHCRDPFLMQAAYKLVDESVKTASLEQLGKVLDDML